MAAAAATAADDLYSRLKELESQIEFLDIQEDYVKTELKNLKRELIRSKQEIQRIRAVPLVIGQFVEMVDATSAIIQSTSGTTSFVRVLSTLDREKLKPNASIALHRHSSAIVEILPPEADSSIQMMQMHEKPEGMWHASGFSVVCRARPFSCCSLFFRGTFKTLGVFCLFIFFLGLGAVGYMDIGGLDIQKQEIREAVELPLTHFELYQQIGIDPPRGVLLWGCA